MAQLNTCRKCGGAAEFITQRQGIVDTIIARCTQCKVQTQSIASSVDGSATEQAAEIWNAISPSTWPDWVQPKGMSDAYSKGSCVTHKKKRWTSILGVNTLEPGVYGWIEQKGAVE